MPLRLSAGVSQKMGLPDYGSLGATCQVEVELEGSLLDHDLERFHHRVREVYVACTQAVQDELARHQAVMSQAAGDQSGEVPAAVEPNGNGHAASVTDGNGRAASRAEEGGQDGQRASARQIEFLQVLAKQIRGLGIRRLERFCQATAGRPLADLAANQASRLIDALKAVRAGRVDLQSVLTEEPS